MVGVLAMGELEGGGAGDDVGGGGAPFDEGVCSKVVEDGAAEGAVSLAGLAGTGGEMVGWTIFVSSFAGVGAAAVASFGTGEGGVVSLTGGTATAGASSVLNLLASPHWLSPASLSTIDMASLTSRTRDTFPMSEAASLPISLASRTLIDASLPTSTIVDESSSFSFSCGKTQTKDKDTT